MQRVIIIGGTGFIGYHSGKELLKRGYSVGSLHLPDLDLEGWFPEEIELSHGDVFEMSDDELIKAMKGYDAMVYAVGPDDRESPKAPSYDFFRKKLVVKATQVFRAAKSAGVKRAVLLNSYFVHFSRMHPELNLEAHHPYIRARKEQADSVIETSGSEMDVMVLELPYIFGAMTGRMPLWKEVFLDRLLRFNPVFYPSGGTAMITVEHVAEAVAGAIEYGEHGERYPIGDVNMEWKEMFSILFSAVGIKRSVVRLPLWIAKIVGAWMQFIDRAKGIEPGLNLRYVFQDIIIRKFYIDPESSVEKLKYGRGDIVESIEKTAKACFPNGYKNRNTQEKAD